MSTRAASASIFFLTGILTAAAAAFVRMRLIVPGDASATATNVLAHQPLFQTLPAADLISAACLAGMSLVFCDLITPASRRLAAAAAFISFLNFPLVAFGGFLHIAALVILRGAQVLHLLQVQPFPNFALVCLELQARATSASWVVFAVCCALITVSWERAK